MTEEDKNTYFENPEHIPCTSFPLPDRITGQFYLLSIMKETDRECTCFLSSKETGRFYILKRCLPGSHDSARQEYEILEKLRGKDTPKSIYLPSYMDFFQDNGASYLLREYLYGYSFREHVANSSTDSLPEQSLLECALALCDALEYLHSQQPPIIHRDIKPDNVILDQYGQFRLIDFGIARYYKKNQQSDTENMGSEQSAAPEQFGYTQTDARTDIYSLGALLLYGATCEYDLEKLNYASISKDLKRIIKTCMQFAPKDRYQNVRELRHDLNQIRLHSDYRQKRNWFFTGVLCGAGLLAVFGLGLFLYIGPNPFSDTDLSANTRSAFKSELDTDSIGNHEPLSRIDSDQNHETDADTHSGQSIETGDNIDSGLNLETNNETNLSQNTESTTDTNLQRESAGFGDADFNQNPETASDVNLIQNPETISELDLILKSEAASDTDAPLNPETDLNAVSTSDSGDSSDTEAFSSYKDFPEPDTSSSLISEADSGAASETSGSVSGSSVPADDEIYTFREPLVEQAARKCLQKEETEPITYRDLQGILFIGIYGHQILDYFDQVWPNISLPYIETEEYLNAGLYKITGELNTLEDFAHMPNLRSLALYNVTLSDLTGLEKLHLEALALGNTAVSSLELISTQTELKKLVLCSNPELTNLDPLTLLPNLSNLSVTVMEPESYDFLWQMPNLEKLTASNPTEELTAALKKSRVKDLKLWNFPYPGDLPLTSLSGCTSLERIELNGYTALEPDRTDACTYLDHETPQELPNLKELCLFGYGYRDFGTLAGLESLETLHLFDGTTSVMLDCRNLDQLPSLTSIYANQEMIDMIAEAYPERKFELYPF